MVGFFQKYWLFLVLALVASLLLTLWMLGRGRPPQEESLPSLPPLAPPQIEGRALPLGININFALPPLPGEAPLYKKEPTVLSEEQAFHIANLLAFSGGPTTPEGALGNYYWNEKERFLHVSLEGGEVTFGRLSEPPKQTNFVENERVENSLKDLIKKLGIVSPEVELVGEEPKYYKLSGDYLEPAAISGADLIELTLTPKISGMRVVGLFGKPLVLGRFTRDGRLFNLNAQAFSVFQDKGISYPLKNEREVQQALRIEGRLVVFGKREEEISPQEGVTSLSINRSELTLFASEKNLGLFPMFLFRGEATMMGGRVVPASIFLPAIKSQYLSQP